MGRAEAAATSSRGMRRFGMWSVGPRAAHSCAVESPTAMIARRCIADWDCAYRSACRHPPAGRSLSKRRVADARGAGMWRWL